MDDLYTVEYSISQGCFHFGLLTDTIKLNRWGVANNVPRDWALLHICRSYEECSQFAEKWRKAGNCPNYSSIYDCEYC